MSQADTIAFLRSGRAFEDDGPVEIIETHGAYVFLSGDTALKLKRAVTYDYMDLSTVELRRKMLERELELNSPAAPGIYRDVLPVIRAPDGLSLGGEGEIADWVLRMWRFPAENEMDGIARRGELDDTLASATGEAIAAYHRNAPLRDTSGHRLVSDILSELIRVFAEFQGTPGTERVADWIEAAGRQLDAVGSLLDARGRDGHVRRVHGDLHLRNLVVLDGRPLLYDALEFDETLGTCDVLYDVAFLVMDLCHRGLPRQACRVLDAWLREARGSEDSGLRALPLFLSVRAAIRAMVSLQTDAARAGPGRSSSEVASYLDLALSALRPPPPQLIAVGGYSGSGKSVLARAIAPEFRPLPGAVLLSSDLERKAGLPHQARLDQKEYDAAPRTAVYHRMFDRAAVLLAAGHSVILDATFLDPELRCQARAIAHRLHLPFRTFWLDAPPQILKRRLESRVGDASDANVAVLERQLAAGHGTLSWTRLDASGNRESVLAAAQRGLSRRPRDLETDCRT
ncbi:bifunctional aminoglycoside phosphotransferase/ATP-binding protein [Histidinibacterium aquaticum]|uniref:AAA family ATPase n=1 Tax=Histidinibacterium aquaticum TaxID=2613962 RepID=A0A5J5GF85_9RHOB|nr:bifunctional aminoglycoside phosphotransferase/ATP-binding protein [Histidinibacterium aquaticum]KAA9006697.1 AAA family ATPase [Histidinibacterium aquaticum]